MMHQGIFEGTVFGSVAMFVIIGLMGFWLEAAAALAILWVCLALIGYVGLTLWRR